MRGASVTSQPCCSVYGQVRIMMASVGRTLPHFFALAWHFGAHEPRRQFHSPQGNRRHPVALAYATRQLVAVTASPNVLKLQQLDQASRRRLIHAARTHVNQHPVHCQCGPQISTR